MANETVFRTKIATTQATEEALPEAKTATSSAIVDTIEVPYLDYQQQHGKPYLVDHFKLGSTWNDPQGGFPKEIARIESYVEEKIKSGEIANSMTAIKTLLKGMEKTTNMHTEERNVIRIEVLANYVEFLMKNDQVKNNARRYSGYA